MVTREQKVAWGGLGGRPPGTGKKKDKPKFRVDLVTGALIPAHATVTPFTDSADQKSDHWTIEVAEGD